MNWHNTMSIHGLKQLLSQCELRGPATGEERRACESALGITFPPDFAQLLELSSGLAGYAGECYVRIYGVSEILDANATLNTIDHKLIKIGSDGADEAFAYDYSQDSVPIVNIPFIGMEREHMQVLGNDVREFLQRLSSAGLFSE